MVVLHCFWCDVTHSMLSRCGGALQPQDAPCKFANAKAITFGGMSCMSTFRTEERNIMLDQMDIWKHKEWVSATKAAECFNIMTCISHHDNERVRFFVCQTVGLSPFVVA